MNISTIMPKSKLRPESLSLQAARDDFLASLAGKADRTQRTYATGVDRFLECLGAHGMPAGSRPSVIQVDALERFYLWLVRRYGQESRATCATYLAAARAFCRFLDRRGLSSVTYERMRAGLAQVMGRQQYRTPRTDERIPNIITYVDSLALPTEREPRLAAFRDRALLRVLYTTGVRRDEAIRLNREDVQDGHSDQALITGKGGRERVIFFDSSTLRAIRAYIEARADTHRPLFLRHDVGRGAPGPRGERWRLGADTVYDVVVKAARALGIRATPHSFRHDRASLLLNRGADLSEVQDILGHASPATTKRIYAHYETRRLREAFDRYSLAPEARERSPRP
jgi:integrase